MPRKTQIPPVLVGVVGTNDMAYQGVSSLLGNWAMRYGDAPLNFVIPFAEGVFVGGTQAIADWAVEYDEHIIAVVEPDFEGADDYRKAFAGPPHETNRVYAKIEEILTTPDTLAAAIVLWDDEDLDSQQSALALHQAGVPLFEMSGGLQEIEDLVLEGDEDEEPAMDGAPTEEPKRESKEVTKEEAVEEPTDDAPEGDAPAWVDDPYTREELSAIGEKDRDELKEIAKEDFQIDFPARTRNNTIVDLILKAQEEGIALYEEAPLPGDADHDPDEQPQGDAPAAGTPPAGFDTDKLVEDITEEISSLMQDLLGPVLTRVEELQEAVDALKERLEQKPDDAAPARRRR